MKGRKLAQRLAILLLALLFASSAARPTAASEDVHLRIAQVQSEGFPQVVVYVTVTDELGQPVESLATSDFALFEEGQAISAFNATPVSSDEGISLILALDVSRSMQGVPLQKAQEAAKAFLSGLSKNDQVALLTFATEVTQLSEFSTNMSALNDAVDSTVAEGWTALNEAVYEAATLAGTLPPGRKAIVVLTDGVDTESAPLLDDAIAQAQKLGVPVYTIGLGTEAQADTLQRLSFLTGGSYLEAPTAQELNDRFETVSDQLRQQYLITYTSAARADDQEHSLVVEVVYQGETARYEHSFLAASTPVTVAVPDLDDGQTVAGVVELAPRFTSVADVERVEYWVDGTLIATVTEQPFTYDWDTSDLMLGTHEIRIAARDVAGNEGEGTFSLIVVPLVEVRITAPADGANVSGEVTIQAEARSYGELDRVDIILDEEFVGSLEVAPYEMTLQVSGVEPGQHRLTARAYDVSSNQAEHSILITVPAPAIPTLVLGLGGVALVAVLIAVWFVARSLRARRLRGRAL